MKINHIYQGDCLKALSSLPSESIDMSISSPPYWALRDYGVEGQLGLEPNFNEYIKKLCDIYDQIKRVLKNTGTCWVNLGDTYYNVNSSMANDGRAGFTKAAKEKFNYSIGSGKCLICGKKTKKQFCSIKCLNTMGNDFRSQNRQLPSKCLTLVPFRFAIEMVNRGWILRNVIIWHKPNCMPSSVKDRFTVDFEYIFFFSKKKKYYFETQKLPVKEVSLNRIKYPFHPNPKHPTVKCDGDVSRFVDPTGRNMRCVWKITTKPFKEAHFAVYPEKLIETPIKAGCPEFVCKKCGKPREKILEPTKEYAKFLGKSWHDHSNDKSMGFGQQCRGFKKKHVDGIKRYDIKGYTDCGCNAGFESGIVLDPFMGAGTTALVSLKNNRKFVGIEISPEYCKIAQKRVDKWLNQQRLGDFK